MERNLLLLELIDKRQLKIKNAGKNTIYPTAIGTIMQLQCYVRVENTGWCNCKFMKIKFHLGVIKSRRMRWSGHVARMGEERGVYRVLVGKSEGKRPLRRPRRRWVYNIRWDVGMWTGLGWPRIETGGGRL